MATKKDRPKNNNNDIIIDGIHAEYLATKTDKFDNSIAYLKWADPKSKSKPSLDTTLQNEEQVQNPWWTTDDQDVILKVKEKRLKVSDELQPSNYYLWNVDASPYSLETEHGTLKGYYATVIKAEKKKWVLF